MSVILWMAREDRTNLTGLCLPSRKCVPPLQGEEGPSGSEGDAEFPCTLLFKVRDDECESLGYVCHFDNDSQW